MNALRAALVLACLIHVSGSVFAAPPGPDAVIVERATAESAVPVHHKSTGEKIAEQLRAKGVSENATIVAISRECWARPPGKA